MKTQKNLLRSFARLSLYPAQREICHQIAAECAALALYAPLNNFDPIPHSRPPQHILDAGVTFDMLKALRDREILRNL